MAIKESFVIFTSFAMLLGFGDSVDLQCEFETHSYAAVGSVYQCIPQNALNIKSRESAVIHSTNGSHSSDKCNDDVTCFYSYGSSLVIEYFPRNLDKSFANLKMILIRFGRLKEIQQSDLRPFTKLERLDLENNDIEFLEDGLFAYNPELTWIDIDSNKIFKIGSQVFDSLNKLAWLYLRGNTCISMFARDNQTVREVISQAKSKCSVQSYSDIDKDLQKLESSLVYVNSKSLPIFDQHLENLQSRFQNSTISGSKPLKERFQAIKSWRSKIETKNEATQDYFKYAMTASSVILGIINIALIIIYV